VHRDEEVRDLPVQADLEEREEAGVAVEEPQRLESREGDLAARIEDRESLVVAEEEFPPPRRERAREQVVLLANLDSSIQAPSDWPAVQRRGLPAAG
jgi:hypothetical protein